MPEVYHIGPLKKRSFFSLFNFSVTMQLIFLNVLCFIIFEIASLFYNRQILASLFYLTPSLIVSGQNLWTLVTSMFLHGGIFHLFFNMISLFYVGMFLEGIIGKKRFLSFYLIAGIFAGIFFALSASFFGTTAIGAKIFGNPNIVGVGASGAIFGLVGLLSVLTPRKKISLIAGPLFAIVLQSTLSFAFPNEPFVGILSAILTFYIILSIFSMFSFNPRLIKLILPINMNFWFLPIVAIVPLVIIGLFVPLPIGNSAHFGGLVVGVVYGFYLRKKFPNKTKHIQRTFR